MGQEANTPWRFGAEPECAGKVLRVRMYEDQRAGTWQQWLDAMLEASAARAAFNAALAAAPFDAFRWECPALRIGHLNAAFECMLIDAPELERPADASPFAEPLSRAGTAEAMAFANLGGDATLVVPTAGAPLAAYAHIGAFVRRAPPAQRDAFWHRVAAVVREGLGQRPLWLSTAGDGVAWLHVRLDTTPKYYRTKAYRTT